MGRLKQLVSPKWRVSLKLRQAQAEDVAAAGEISASTGMGQEEAAHVPWRNPWTTSKSTGCFVSRMRR